MVPLIKSYKRTYLLFGSFVFAGGIAYIGLHIRQFLLHIYNSLGTAWQPPPLWVLTGALVGALLVFAIRRKGFWLDFFLYLQLCYIAVDILRIPMYLLSRTGAAAVWQAVYFGGGLPILLTCGLCLYGYHNALNVRIRPYSLRLRESGEALRIALISDIHLGAGTRPEEFKRIFSLLARQSADILLLCGDIYEERTTKEQYHASLDVLRALHIPGGIYYVPGNHEYQAARRGTLHMETMLQDMRNAGVTMLQDGVLLLQNRFYLAGRQDQAAPGLRKRLSSLLSGLDSEKPVIVMDHRPQDMENAQSCGVDLLLSGHTHAGQLLPVGRLCERFAQSAYNYGHRVQGGMHSIITSGAGTWGYPMRIGSRSEIVLLDVVL